MSAERDVLRTLVEAAKTMCRLAMTMASKAALAGFAEDSLGPSVIAAEEVLKQPEMPR